MLITLATLNEIIALLGVIVPSGAGEHRHRPQDLESTFLRLPEAVRDEIVYTLMRCDGREPTTAEIDRIRTGFNRNYH